MRAKKIFRILKACWFGFLFCLVSVGAITLLLSARKPGDDLIYLPLTGFAILFIASLYFTCVDVKGALK